MLWESEEVGSVVRMIEAEHLDIRTTTMGISLRDCITDDLSRTCTKVYDKVTRRAERLDDGTQDRVGLAVSAAHPGMATQDRCGLFTTECRRGRQQPAACCALFFSVQKVRRHRRHQLVELPRSDGSPQQPHDSQIVVVSELDAQRLLDSSRIELDVAIAQPQAQLAPRSDGHIDRAARGLGCGRDATQDRPDFFVGARRIFF